MKATRCPEARPLALGSMYQSFNFPGLSSPLSKLFNDSTPGTVLRSPFSLNQLHCFINFGLLKLRPLSFLLPSSYMGHPLVSEVGQHGANNKPPERYKPGFFTPGFCGSPASASEETLLLQIITRALFYTFPVRHFTLSRFLSVKPDRLITFSGLSVIASGGSTHMLRLLRKNGNVHIVLMRDFYNGLLF